MDPRTRFLSVFSSEREHLDRVPTFVQGILGGFTQKYESILFDNYEGELVYHLSFDAPLVLGFDAVFASMPSSVTCDPIKVVSDGIEYMMGLGGQKTRAGTRYYAGGLITSLDVLDEVWSHLKVNDTRVIIKQTLDFYDTVSKLICPVPMVGGIFDTVWQAMGFSTFAKEYRKNSKLYQKIIEFYANVTKTNIEKIIESTKNQAKIINILDDVAYKGHPLISPDRWRSDFYKYYKEITGMIRDVGMNVIMHSDGDVTSMVPHFMDAGFQGLQGWEGGADPRVIAEKYPGFVTIGWGDVGDVLPFGDRPRIEQHVIDLMQALKANRHVVMGPSTVIFEKIPYENAIFFVECIKKHGKY
nr:uroporphyrinogen decarboxylase family protein [Candidatus Sigynarchaeota archaeon]